MTGSAPVISRIISTTAQQSCRFWSDSTASMNWATFWSVGWVLSSDMAPLHLLEADQCLRIDFAVILGVDVVSYENELALIEPPCAR